MLMNGNTRIKDADPWSHHLHTLGTVYDARKIKTVSGYVLQDDLLLPYLSVR
jgi:hypothetical protein